MSGKVKVYFVSTSNNTKHFIVDPVLVDNSSNFNNLWQSIFREEEDDKFVYIKYDGNKIRNLISIVNNKLEELDYLELKFVVSEININGNFSLPYLCNDKLLERFNDIYDLADSYSLHYTIDIGLYTDREINENEIAKLDPLFNEFHNCIVLLTCVYLIYHFNSHHVNNYNEEDLKLTRDILNRYSRSLNIFDKIIKIIKNKLGEFDVKAFPKDINHLSSSD